MIEYLAIGFGALSSVEAIILFSIRRRKTVKNPNEYTAAIRCCGCGHSRKITKPTVYYKNNDPMWEKSLRDICIHCGSIHFEDRIGRPVPGTHIWEWKDKPQEEVKKTKEQRVLELASELEVDQEMRDRLFNLLKVHVEPIQ